MKYPFIILFLLCTHTCFSQKETYKLNGELRKEMEFHTKEKIFYQELYMINQFSQYGDTIQKNKLQEFSLKNYSDTSVSFILENITVEIADEIFVPEAHHLRYFKGLNFLGYIDGKPIFGTHGKLPGRKIKTIKFINGSEEIKIPNKALRSLYNLNFCWKVNDGSSLICYTHAYRSADKQRIYVDMVNSDGAGTYEVTWIFKDGKYFGRVVDLLN